MGPRAVLAIHSNEWLIQTSVDAGCLLSSPTEGTDTLARRGRSRRGWARLTDKRVNLDRSFRLTLTTADWPLTGGQHQ
ncbi:MAG: hypothetical protein CMJ81_23360 [Planctomycetaceae bacterium]|nr:hypothetical protein [Planctomycetaceae bacterium]